MKMRYLRGKKGNKRDGNDTVNHFLVAERGVGLIFACILKEGHASVVGYE